MEKKYCVAPWRGLHINFAGQVKTCCAGDPNMLGSLNENTIEEILANPVLQQIRSSIKQGKLHPEYCDNCIRAEHYGSSEREWHNNLSADFDFESAPLDEHIPVIADVRWNNTCNLSCNYCMPICSSKWADIMGEPHNDSIKGYYQQVVDYLEANQESVKEVALVGGEPLLLKENSKLLDVLPDDVLVTVITNLSVDFSKNTIAQKLLERDRVGWSISFDNTGRCFEYVRHGASWEIMDRNISKVADRIINGNHHGGAHAVYNLYNCTKLCELKSYTDSRQIGLHWQTLHRPECLDPLQHNGKIKQLAYDEVTRYLHMPNLSGHEQAYAHGIVDVLSVQQGKAQANKDLYLTNKAIADEFYQFTDNIENKYHPNSKGMFPRLWPEIAQAL
jgi:hypothetical protein